MGAFHLVKISGISGSAVNGTRFVGSSHWKIPRKSGKSKKVGPFSQLEFPNGISCFIYTFLVICTSSRSTVGHRDVTGLTTKWNNPGTTFYQSEIPRCSHRNFRFFSQMESALRFRSAGSFPEQRLIIEPGACPFLKHFL